MSRNGNQYVAIAVDALTKYVEAMRNYHFTNIKSKMQGILHMKHWLVLKPLRMSHSICFVTRNIFEGKNNRMLSNSQKCSKSQKTSYSTLYFQDFWTLFLAFFGRKDLKKHIFRKILIYRHVLEKIRHFSLFCDFLKFSSFCYSLGRFWKSCQKNNTQKIFEGKNNTMLSRMSYSICFVGWSENAETGEGGSVPVPHGDRLSQKNNFYPFPPVFS